jgi:hypothetical protein
MKRSEAEKAIVDTLKAMRICIEDCGDENVAKHIIITLINIGIVPSKLWEKEDET